MSLPVAVVRGWCAEIAAAYNSNTRPQGQTTLEFTHKIGGQVLWWLKVTMPAQDPSFEHLMANPWHCGVWIAEIGPRRGKSARKGERTIDEDDLGCSQGIPVTAEALEGWLVGWLSTRPEIMTMAGFADWTAP